jgi:hypothetical protein
LTSTGTVDPLLVLPRDSADLVGLVPD